MSGLAKDRSVPLFSTLVCICRAAEGEVWCFGSNECGQLGIGHEVGHKQVEPRLVKGLKGEEYQLPVYVSPCACGGEVEGIQSREATSVRFISPLNCRGPRGGRGCRCGPLDGSFERGARLDMGTERRRGAWTWARCMRLEGQSQGISVCVRNQSHALTQRLPPWIHRRCSQNRMVPSPGEVFSRRCSRHHSWAVQLRLHRPERETLHLGQRDLLAAWTRRAAQRVRASKGERCRGMIISSLVELETWA